MAVAHPKINISPEGPRPWRWTVEQYHQLAEAGWFDDKRVELIDGEIIEMAPIGGEHIAATVVAPEALRVAFGIGFFIVVQGSVLLNDNSQPQPDIAVFRGDIRDLQGAVPRNPVLVVEVSDTTLRIDLSQKTVAYAGANIPEYWVIDLVNHELVVHRQPSQVDENWLYVQVTRLKKGESIVPLHAPQSPVAVSDLML